MAIYKYAKLIALILLLLSLNLSSQIKSKAIWERHSCGYNNGINTYNGDLISSAVCADSYGNVYNTGNLSGSFLTIDTSIISIGKNKAFINKFTSKGKRIWTKFIQSSSINVVINITKIKTDENGDIYICGSANCINDSIFMAPNWYKINNGFIAKFDANMNNLWCTIVNGPKNNTSNLHFNDLNIQGYIYCCGNATFGNFKFGNWTLTNPQSKNAFVTALNKYNGEVMKARLIDTGSVNTVYSIFTNKYLNCYIVGEVISSKTGYFKPGSDSIYLTPNAINSYVLKMANVFRPIWLKKGITYQGSSSIQNSEIKCLKHISIDKNENIYVAGNNNGDSFKIESLSFKNRVSTNGNYKQDFYVSKFNKEGEIKWLKHFGSNGTDFITDLICDPNGNLLISCGSENNSTYGIVVNLDTIKQRHGGLIKLDSNGDVIFVKTLQEYKYPKAISFGNDSSFYLTGTGINFNNPYDSITIGYCEHPNGTPSYSNMYIVKFEDYTSKNISKITKSLNPHSSLSIFPNPTTNIIEFKSINNDNLSLKISIYNTLGQLILTLTISDETEKVLDISFLEPGVYSFKITNEKGQISENKIIKL